MKWAILIAVAAMLAAPAAGQRLRLENEPATAPTAPFPQRPDLTFQDAEPLPPCPTLPDRTAKKEFVEAFNAASKAITARDWGAALDFTARARPHTKLGRQTAFLLQLEVAAYNGNGDTPALKNTLRQAIADPCTQSAVRRNYQQMLDKMAATEGKPEQQ